jgi:hypothetical protein
MLLLIDNPELLELALETAKKEGRPIKGRTKKAVKRMVKGGKGKSRV